MFSRILAPLCQAVRVQLPSLLSVHSSLHPQSSFQHTHIRLSGCPSPLKTCSQGLRYRGNRITFGRETPRFISTIMRQNGLGGKSNILPTCVIAGLWVNKRLSIRVLKYLLTSIIIIRAPTEFYSGIIKKMKKLSLSRGDLEILGYWQVMVYLHIKQVLSDFYISDLILYICQAVPCSFPFP